MGPTGIGRYRFFGVVAAGMMTSTLLMASAFADSLWDHNGSVMRLSERGMQIEIFYEVPRTGMVEQGVKRGQLLFNGRREGNRVIGIARAFLRRCAAPLEYAIQGNMIANNTIILKGRRPVFKDCLPQKTLKDDELVFIFLSGGTEVQAAASGSEAPQVSNSPETGSASGTGLARTDALLRLHQPWQ